MDQNTWEAWFGFTAGWSDAVRDLRDDEHGFSRDLTLRGFGQRRVDFSTYLAFYLAGYDTLTRGYIPASVGRASRGDYHNLPERFDLHRLGGLAP